MRLDGVTDKIYLFFQETWYYISRGSSDNVVCCLIESLLLLFHRQLGSADFTLTTIDAGGHIAIVNCQRSALIALMCALSYRSTTILGRFL